MMHLNFKAEDMDPVIECPTEGTVHAAPLLLTSESWKNCETSMSTLPNAPDCDRNIEDVSVNIFHIGLGRCFIDGLSRYLPDRPDSFYITLTSLVEHPFTGSSVGAGDVSSAPRR